MYRVLIRALFGTLLLFTTAQLKARETRVLEPSAPWVVEWAKDNCRLSRAFGQGNERIILVMDQFEPGDWFKMMLVGNSIEPRLRKPIEARLRFGPTGAETEVTAIKGEVGEELALIFDEAQRVAPLSDAERAAREDASRRHLYFEARPVGVERERAATTLEVSKALRRNLVLRTGAMAKPMAALRACSWDMVKSWGLDVEQQSRRAQPPVPKSRPSEWFRSSDYPPKMLDAGYQAS